LKAIYHDCEKETRTAGRDGGYRITVGVKMGMFFDVKAQGDNWTDVVRKLEDKLSPVTS
jgi:hypothetical protein